ncbi:2-hydroxyacid dehydrogenase [Phormidium sp. LEGE 05292]|uniref:2-hydroxyacid dehydrogenase n=1 Tax=[Phormidium] sp. LEGE 05292 TaxID=767427 RepID=UPI001882CC84|nr:2-hydroxyacid dehydrogenase [Phormidium sp. LEGE 05292]MBE9229455.1 2-hydroxyacid dehydrogenase [Phormidium sp. LEGE 05292]
MRVAVFSTKPYDRRFLEAANEKYGHELAFFTAEFNANTAPLAADFPAVCIFVNDNADAKALEIIASRGTKLLALRSAGFNHVDLQAAADLGITVLRVPAYSPYAIAEHAVGLILTLNRKFHRAYNRVREGNFALEGLMGFDIHGRTVGVIGTGKIGQIFGNLMKGFGCQVLAYDLYPNADYAASGIKYVDLPELFANSDIISLHCPLSPETYHLIDEKAIAQMKTGVTIVNTSRGALVNTEAVIAGLKSGKIGYLGLDVYEQEGELFFEDLSNAIIQDDVFQRLLTFPNVIVTGHQAFFTEEAVRNICETTLSNVSDFEQGIASHNEVKSPQKTVAK